VSAKKLAAFYAAQGWRIVPIPHGSKNPNTKDWPNRTFEPKHITQNVGVILGPVSGGLVDVDLDSTDALALAPYFLPETLTFGRESKPASHWLFKCEGVRADKLWFGPKDDRELIEIRAQNATGDGCGHQTVFPGSVHESGEAIDFDNAVEPTEIDAGDLIWAVAKLATASTIAKGWTSGRHEKSLAITGGLLKAGWTAEDVRDTMAAVRECCGDTEAEEADFGHDVESTITKAEAEGVDVLSGFGSLVQAGVLEDHEAKALERHSRTPATRKRELGLAKSKIGRGMLAEMVAHAHEVDGLETVGDTIARAAAPVARAKRTEAEVEAEEDQPLEHLGVIKDLSTDPKPIPYLIEGLALGPGKISTVNGYAGTAKGLLLSLIALCVASGEDFLGLPVRRKRVLYLDAETGRLAETRIKRIARGLGIDVAELEAEGWITFVEARPPITEEFLTELAFAIDTARIGLVCGDSYTSLVGGDQNEASFADVAFRLGGLSNTTQCTVLATTHARKTQQGTKRGPALEMVSGHNALVAAMQTGISVTRPSEEEDTLLEIRCARSPEEGFAPFRIKWSDISDPEAGTTTGAKLKAEKWGLMCERVALEGKALTAKDLEKAAEAENRRQKVLKFLKLKGCVSQRQVVASLQGGTTQLRETLLSLVEEGAVEVLKLPGGFEYRIPPK
jgi:hypothetical protein